MTSRLRTALAAAASLALAAGLAACHPARLGQGRPRDDRPMAVNARLDCPEHAGELSRTDQAADGRSCRYAGDDGEQLTLTVLPLDGRTPAAALAPTEASLRALAPAAVAGTPEHAAAVAAKAKDKDADKDDGDDDDSGNTAGAGANAVAASSDGKRGHVAINLPGVHLDADDGGARVHAFGQDVVADDSGADVRTGWNGVQSHIHADEGGAEIRAGWTGRHAQEQSYLLSSEQAGPTGVHTAGYVARGPVGGPLVLAVVTSRAGDNDANADDPRMRDARTLVRRNTPFR